MEQFTIKTAFALGERDEKYGQSWYATVQEMTFPIMFNLMEGSVQELDKITFETQEISKFKSGKNAGKEYRRLKKVKVVEGASRMIEPEKPAQQSEVLSDILKRLTALENKVFGSDTEEIQGSTSSDMWDEQKPIDLNDIPF